MKALAFSPAAASDINEIWNYSADTWGPDQADRYTDDLRDMCVALARSQKRGRAVDLLPNYLKYPCGSHVIFFKDRGDRLEIVRILHQRQDVSKNLHS